MSRGPVWSPEKSTNREFRSQSGSVAFSTSPAAAASRALRTAVFREDLTALLRSRAFSLVLIRLIWDLMFATNEPLQVQARDRSGPVPGDF